MAETITVDIQRVLYPKTEIPSGVRTWCIVKTDKGVAKGKFSWPVAEKERVIMTGAWQQSQYSGQLEFVFTEARHYIPTAERDSLHYACVRTNGLGDAAEKKIWDTYGDNWREMDPSVIKGIRQSTYAAFLEVVSNMEVELESSTAIAWLMGKGATLNMAEAAYGKWKTATISKVSADPYILAELDGYSFRDVDGHISSGFGIAQRDTRRIDAAVMHYVRKCTESDTVVEWRVLCGKVTESIGVSDADVAKRVKIMFGDGRLHPIASISSIATGADYAREKAIFDFINL